MRWTKLPPALIGAALLGLPLASPAAAAGNLTLPFADPNPRVTSWTDHHYPTREADGIMIRFDGATGYAYDGHRGTDYAVPANTPVVAADDGVVIYSEWSDTGGWGIVIDHAYDRTAYFHNNQLLVYPGQHVVRGQLIALSGSTGNSTGPHVHFEVRDLFTPWHSVDPYGWTGNGADPWSWDMGYLWTSNPPAPFLLPLAFFGGAHWNAWYGADGPPPPVTWHIRDNGRGLAGYAAGWDADPGRGAARTASTTGSAVVPGPGSHTLHLRVFDQAGGTADFTYLYLYDVTPPTSALRTSASASTAVPLVWSGQDALAGIKDLSVEVARDGGGFRPWYAQTVDQPRPGATTGSARFFGEPGSTYQLRLTVRDAARNPAPPVTVTASVPAGATRAATAADAAVLGPLPGVPSAASSTMGLRAEQSTPGGGLLLGTDAALHGVGMAPTPALHSPTSLAAAIDQVITPSGPIRLLADGSTWDTGGTAGPHLAAPAPVRLLATSDGTLMAVDAGGGIVGGGGSVAQELAPGATLVDAGLFPGTHAGLALDTSGVVHAFGGAGAALLEVPAGWTLPGQPAGITVMGSPQSPAGWLVDTNGNRQAFGSLLLLPDGAWSRPAFDQLTGLVLR